MELLSPAGNRPQSADTAARQRQASVTGRARRIGMVAGTGQALLLAGAALVAAPAPAPASLQVPGRASAHVSLAADGAFVVAVWAGSLPGGATDIYASASRDGGSTFSLPARVNATAGDARVNGEQPPRAALTPRPGAAPEITVVWTAKGAAGTRLQTARSGDGGRTFTTVVVPGTDTAGNRGWEAITAAGPGRVHLVWLDHRRLAQADAAKSSSAPAAHHDHTASAGAQHDGVAMAQLSELYVGTLGEAAIPPRGITGGVCYCCKTALATGPDGTVNIAWRHVYPGNLRDIAFASSTDGGRSFTAPLRVSEDKWQLHGCPDDGPAMAVDPDSRVHLIWPTLVQGRTAQPTIGLFSAAARRGGRFSPRVPIPTEGLPHHPQIAIAGGSVVAAWDELKSGVRQVVVARAPLGERQLTFSRWIVSGSTGGVYPSLVATGRGAVVAWTAAAGATSTVKVVPIPPG
jgi:hypothetical protein